MAFNPAHYESIYGFDTLDTFHNFFPELMYDDELFSDTMATWMRWRMNRLFPTVFVRQQNMYRMYLGVERATQFQEFLRDINNNIGFQSARHHPMNVIRTPPRTGLTNPTRGMFSQMDADIQHDTTTSERGTRTIANPAAARAYRIDPQTNAVVRVLNAETANALATLDRLAPLLPTRTQRQTPLTTVTAVAPGAEPAVVISATVPSPVPSVATGPVRVPPPVPTTTTNAIPSTIVGAAEAGAGAGAGAQDLSGNPVTPRNQSTRRGAQSYAAAALQNIFRSAIPSVSAAEALIFASVFDGTGADLLNDFSMTPRNIWQDDVPVVPTNDQIEQGSSIVAAVDVPLADSCSICQDRGDSTQVWRQLNCHHYYHQRCIDEWFCRNVHCPVCRADIRELGQLGLDSSN